MYKPHVTQTVKLVSKSGGAGTRERKRVKENICKSIV